MNFLRLLFCFLFLLLLAKLKKALFHAFTGFQLLGFINVDEHLGGFFWVLEVGTYFTVSKKWCKFSPKNEKRRKKIGVFLSEYQ